jgi:hypothetical protein
MEETEQNVVAEAGDPPSDAIDDPKMIAYLDWLVANGCKFPRIRYPAI